MGEVFADGALLSIDVPQGFSILTLDELQTLFGLPYDNLWGVRNESRRMRLCLLWKDSNAVLTKLVSEKSLAKRVENTFAKSGKTYDYACEGYFSREVAGRTAQGFRCSYKLNGVLNTCEVLVFKRKERCYTLFYYTLADQANENLPIYEAMLESISIKA